MPVIQLVSSDGEKFPVELDIIKQSVTIKTMLEDLGIDDDSNSEPVPLPNVEASILRKIIEWCNKHKDDARDKFTEISLSKLPEWYVEKQMLGQARCTKKLPETDPTNTSLYKMPTKNLFPSSCTAW